MGKRKNSKQTPNVSADWVKSYSIQINGRNVESGTELKIKGQRGRFRFIHHVVTPAGAEWIDVWGGPKGSEQWRSFRTEQVQRVHYKNQTGKNLVKARKEEEEGEVKDG